MKLDTNDDVNSEEPSVNGSVQPDQHDLDDDLVDGQAGRR